MADEYDGSDLPTVWRPWQQHIIDSIQQAPDNRTINVVYDPIGNAGKSMLCKYVLFKNLGAYYIAAEAKNIMAAVAEEGPRKAFMFDIPKTIPKAVSWKDLWFSLEAIKNGLGRGMLFRNPAFCMKSPHVWLFTNHKPKFNELSQDRFKVWSINRDDWTLQDESVRD